MSPSQQLDELLKQARCGQLTRSKALTYLDLLQQDLVRWAEQLQAIPAPPDQHAEAEVVRRESLQGLELVAQGVQMARDFLSGEEEDETAEEALRLASDGDQILRNLYEQRVTSIEDTLEDTEGFPSTLL